ncbi:hypothetical protein RDI58_019828 [Solanum bulbocastanum]|uniref:Uncharacterized protein n=1 Tax=Solanum bulbocastanum TaxID=147425 RepID=A0AAN8TBM4_SOLBU
MHATLMWTINDFPAYGMLSGWMTAGKLECPYCMKDTKSFTLKHGRKNSWFDCHRQFLPPDHEFRRNKYAFKKNKTERDGPPPILTGDDIWKRVQNFPKVTEEPPYKFDGKTKDNVKARLDLLEHCRRPDLHLQESANNKLLKPKASYSFTMEQKRKILQSLSIFNQPGKGSKKRTLRKLTEKEKKSVELHVLLNCPEVKPFLDFFVSQYGHDQVFPSFITWYTNWVYNSENAATFDQFFKDIS